MTSIFKLGEHILENKNGILDEKNYKWFNDNLKDTDIINKLKEMEQNYQISVESLSSTELNSNEEKVEHFVNILIDQINFESKDEVNLLQFKNKIKNLLANKQMKETIQATYVENIYDKKYIIIYLEIKLVKKKKFLIFEEKSFNIKCKKYRILTKY